MARKVAADTLGEEWNSYVVQIGSAIWQTSCLHEAGSLDPWPCLPAVE